MLACLFLTDGSTDVVVKLLILEPTLLYSESMQVMAFGSRKNLPRKDNKQMIPTQSLTHINLKFLQKLKN